MKKALLFLLVIGVVGAAVGYYEWNKPKENMTTSKAEATIDATQLLSEYTANEDAANAKYLGKTIAVSGKVKETSKEDAPTATHEAIKEEEQKPIVVKEPAPTEPTVTCDSLGIPSYEFWIRDLSTLRCESCHNDKLSFNGVKLLTYEDFQTYETKAKNRIETNMLTKPLDPIEQGLFLKWFANGMPRTEKDCAGKS